jgi:hypothetical protein
MDDLRNVQSRCRGRRELGLGQRCDRRNVDGRRWWHGRAATGWKNRTRGTRDDQLARVHGDRILRRRSMLTV